ncbi:MAG: glycosyltransferase [Proteobacteria bacterium]|nr:glycosyltransferase [Pseudomonadota bacterium]
MFNPESSIIRGLFSLLSPPGPRGRLTTLMFHKIPLAPDPLVPDELCLQEFEIILDFLQQHMQLVTLGEAAAALASGRLPARAVAITFDDGYAEWISHVAPLLRQRRIPATFFISTEALDGSALWHERIVAGVRALPIHGARLPYGFGGHGDLSSQVSRIKLVGELLERLKYAPLPERLATIAQLEAQAVGALVLPAAFDAAAVRDLHSQGFEIGAHTVRHPILNECSEAEAIAEIGGSREALCALTRGPVNLFAYPNGRPGRDYNSQHVRMVRQSGYLAAVASTGGAASASSDIFQLPRSTLWGTSRERMAYRVARNLRTPELRVQHPAQGENPRPTDVRCLLVASTFPPINGGSAVVYENLCLHMPPGSIRVLAAKNNYLTHGVISGWKEHDASLGFAVDRLPYLRPLMLPPPANLVVSLYRLIFQDLFLYARILLKAALIVRQQRINVVCVGELVTGSWLGLALRKLFGCGLIIYVHGEEVTTQTAGRLHGNRRRSYLQAADKVISVSSFTCDALTREMGLPSEAIALVPNGVDTDRFSPGAADLQFLAAHGLAGKRLIVSVGRLVPRKGMDMAIRAMPAVLRQVPEARLLIIGDGEYRPELMRIIDEEAMHDQVTLVGKVSDRDLLRYLQACELFVMPNRTMPDGDTEGFGLVFREANACGKPVVGGRAGGAVEAVVDGQSGLLVDGCQPTEIAAAIVGILSDAELARQMSSFGLKLAQENNTRAVAERFLKICERLLEQSLAPSK